MFILFYTKKESVRFGGNERGGTNIADSILIMRLPILQRAQLL